ncbi:hypothetical protein HFO30_31635 [Rhizobium laguerreae]|nr:hypothetical protein [Rhizobium laguerreae]
MQIDTIFCDQVRNEINSKHILVGVYPADYISVPVLPGSVYLSTYTRVRGLPYGPHQFQVRFHNSTDPLTPTAVFDTSADVTQSELPTTLVAGPIALIVETPGFVTVRIQIIDPFGFSAVFDAGRVFIAKA